MDNFDINDLKVHKQIQFIDNKMFFMGEIVKVDNKFLEVTISNAQNHIKTFKVNDIAIFFIVFEKEAYLCQSAVIGNKMERCSQILILEQPEVINKIERRKSPRLSTIFDIEYCILPDNICELSKVTQGYQRSKKKTFTIDISEGGIALVTYEKIETRRLVFLSFQLKENITSVCSAVRSELNKDNINFKTALKFVDIDSNHKNIISQYINERMKSNK